MLNNDILVLGGGSLARSICVSYATIGTAASNVTIVSRRGDIANDICFISDVRSTLSDIPRRYQCIVVEDYAIDELYDVFSKKRPAIVINCASPQSPWERNSKPSAWTELVTNAGFGLSLPFQASVAVKAAAAISKLANPPLFINASFPDAVNPLISKMRLPIFCGIGNVLLLSASLSEARRSAAPKLLRVLGHHWHLHTPHSPQVEAIAWIGDDRIPDVSKLLERQRRTSRSQLNAITGHVAAHFLNNLLTLPSFRASVPGPLGLPGGYPTIIKDRTISIDLPSSMNLSEAIETNKHWSLCDGVNISNVGDICFSETATMTVRKYISEFESVHRINDLDRLFEILSSLRDFLRSKPASNASGDV